jgi:hypothetical protein
MWPGLWMLISSPKAMTGGEPPERPQVQAGISLVRSLLATSLFVQRLGASDLRPQEQQSKAASYCLIDSAPLRFGRDAQKAPSIGIQTTQRSNWYSKQVDQTFVYQPKQIDTDLFQITPARQIPRTKMT